VSGTLLDGRVLFAGGETSRIPTFQSATANVDLFNPTTNGWVDLAPMSTSRSLAAAATLLNGRVLVTGGTDGRDGVRASAEYYDQPTNGWHGAGALSSPRYGHTLIALADGSAIAVGGNNVTDCNCTRFQSTVDRYDPVANNWVAANPLAIARERHTATLLPNGKVLVTGGYGGAPNTLADTGASLASAELFDPATGNWTTTGSMNTPRRNHIAILLSGGRVLVAGGTNGATILASAEIYDPATGLWTPAASMHAARDVASVAMLANGNVLVVNGLNGASSAAFGTGTCEVYDPVADSWSATVPTAVPRTGGLATALPDGRVMVVGGWPNYAGAPEFYR
jgi:N-acetylneuraminic acid mutarotase